jgi:hypothetical protein
MVAAEGSELLRLPLRIFHVVVRESPSALACSSSAMRPARRSATSTFDRASCLRSRNGVADLANFCGLSPPRWAQGSAFGRAWSSLGAPVWHAKFSAYSAGSDVALAGAKPLSGRGHARTQSDPRKYRGSSKSNERWRAERNCPGVERCAPGRCRSRRRIVNFPG